LYQSIQLSIYLLIGIFESKFVLIDSGYLSIYNYDNKDNQKSLLSRLCLSDYCIANGYNDNKTLIKITKTLSESPNRSDHILFSIDNINELNDLNKALNDQKNYKIRDDSSISNVCFYLPMYLYMYLSNI
jgi:hypothetical protein